MIPRAVRGTGKQLLAGTLYWTGVLDVWLRRRLRNRILVLMYHRVLTDAERARTGSHPGIVVSTRSFESQMKAVKKRFHVLSMTEFIDILTSGRPVPPSSCLITFDDGWLDNYTNALPILVEQQLPACVFLPVDYIGEGRLFWREALAHQVVHAVVRCREDAALAPPVRAALAPWTLEHLVDLHDDDPRQAIVDALASIRAADAAAARSALARLRSIIGSPSPRDIPDQFVTWEHVREMSSAGISFGSHGAGHILLDLATAEEAAADIQRSWIRLTKELAAPVRAFSYPNGNWTPAARTMVRDAGFAVAFTTKPDTAGTDDDPLTIGRINVHEGSAGSAPMFMAGLCGLF